MFAISASDSYRSLQRVADGGQQTSRGFLSEAKATGAIVALTMVALSVSIYLGWTSLTSSKVVGCGSGGIFDCGHVLTTKWSLWMGIPVGVVAAVLYAFLLLSIAARWMVRQPQLMRVANTVIVTSGFSAGLAAIWFLGLQVFAIGHLCPWCMAAHSCGLAIAALLLWSRPLGKRIPGKPLGAAVLGVALLVSGQVTAEAPATYEVQRFDEDVMTTPAGSPSLLSDPGTESTDESAPFEAPVFEAPDTAAPVFEAPSSGESEAEPDDSATGDHAATGNHAATAITPLWQFLLSDLSATLAVANVRPLPLPFRNMLTLSSMFQVKPSVVQDGTKDSQQSVNPPARTAVSREVSLAGKTRLKVNDWPLYGRSDAQYLFVEMFDYTCPHCRATHQSAIRELRRRYGENIAIVALAVPLNAKCNNTVTQTHAHHAEACELAELAVAVWLADRTRFSAFHNWLFEGTRSRTASEAHQQAIALVGQEQLQKARSKPACAQYVQKQVELYRLMGSGTVPKLLFHSTVLVGQIDSADTIADVLERTSTSR